MTLNKLKELFIFLSFVVVQAPYVGAHKNDIAVNVMEKEVQSILRFQSLLQKDFAVLRKELTQMSNFVRSQLPLDCSGVQQKGDWRRIAKIKPPNMKPIKVQCDQFTDGGRWTVIVHRTSNFDVGKGNFHFDEQLRSAESEVNFNRTWNEYRNGFGSVDGEYWIGNEVLHSLTNEIPWEAAVVLEDWKGVKGYAFWKYFQIKNEKSKYVLQISGYDAKKSSLGDGLLYHSGSSFSTMDADNDNYRIHCAQKYGGGWWFNKCHVSHLTGSHLTPGSKGQHAIHWLPWKGDNEALKTATLMIRPPKPSLF